jgi:hypothetical protein
MVIFPFEMPPSAFFGSVDGLDFKVSHGLGIAPIATESGQQKNTLSWHHNKNNIKALF